VSNFQSRMNEISIKHPRYWIFKFVSNLIFHAIVMLSMISMIYIIPVTSFVVTGFTFAVSCLGCLTPRQTGQLIIGRNLTFTLTSEVLIGSRRALNLAAVGPTTVQLTNYSFRVVTYVKA
jgi:hypothetical protein